MVVVVSVVVVGVVVVVVGVVGLVNSGKGVKGSKGRCEKSKVVADPEKLFWSNALTVEKSYQQGSQEDLMMSPKCCSHGRLQIGSSLACLPFACWILGFQSESRGKLGSPATPTRTTKTAAAFNDSILRFNYELSEVFKI